MKRVVSFLCIASLLIFSLTACSGTAQSETSQSETSPSGTDYSGQTLTGKVIAVDGTLVTIQLGELSDNIGEGGSAQMPADAGSEPTDSGFAGGEIPPDMPADNGNAESSETPPELPDGETGDAAFGSDNEATPPDVPRDDGNAESGEAPPELPDGETGDAAFGSDNGATPPDMPGGQQDGKMEVSDGFTANGETAIVDIDGAAILLAAASDSEDSSEGSVDDIVVGAVLSIQVDNDNAVSTVTVLSAGENGENGGFGGSGEVTQGTSANTIDTDGEYSDTSYSSTGDDENALRVDGASVTLKGITVEKSAGSSSNTEDGDFYGMNAALLATDGANVTITDANITSSAQNGNGVFSYGTGTVVNISDSTITTTADNSGGIQTTGGGTTNASNLTVETSSFSMTGGSLLSNNGDLFYITNTACSIYLSDVEITNKDESGYLMNISGNSASHGWGTAGENGAQVVFTADGQTLEGDIVVDTISTLNMTLSGNSSFTGTINIAENAQNGTAVSDNAVVIIESGSTWTLTGDCTITSLTNNGTINFNDFTVTLSDGTVLN